MRIAYVPSDMDGPGSYRCLFPGRQLKARGHNVSMPPRTENERDDKWLEVTFHLSGLLENASDDIWVLQQRNERLWVEAGIYQLRRRGVVVVADCDDNYIELPTYNPAFVGTHPYKRDDGVIVNRNARRAAKKALPRQFKDQIAPNRANRFHMSKSFELVDALTVSTPYLADLYSRHNSNIKVIRNYLDWEMWDDIDLAYERENERLRVGYWGGMGYRKNDLEVIKPVIAPFLRDHPEIDFVASEQNVLDFLEVPKDQQQLGPDLPFRAGKYLQQVFNEMKLDVGLVPLAINGLNQGKSHLKGMEYNASGIPFIASPTESYANYWCDPGSNGFLASNHQEWRDCLEVLVGDESLRRGMGKRGRAIASNHTIQRNVGEWEDFYLGLLGDDAEALARKAARRGAIQKAKELAPLLRLLRTRRPEVVVEIGSAYGGTFWAWCQVAAPDALLISIDLPFGDFLGKDEKLRAEKGSDRYGRTETPIAKMRSYLRGNQRAEFIVGDSQSGETRERLERILEGRSVDFILIDGDHAYKGVKRDFELYAPLVDGLIAFHDIMPHPRSLETQVHKLWAEIKKSGLYETQEFVHPSEDWGWGKWGGIGVLEHERVREIAA